MKLFERLDTDGSGEIEFGEFFEWYSAEAGDKTKGLLGGAGSSSTGRLSSTARMRRSLRTHPLR